MSKESVHTRTHTPRMLASAHARTPADRRTSATRVHHAYIDDDVRGICTWRYAHVRAPAIVQYIRCHDEEGESDSSPLESARYTDDGRMRNPADDGKYPRQYTATSHSGRGDGE